jgi:endonuclease/exonuclease/phosphatase family metal-dependent hydrolase
LLIGSIIVACSTLAAARAPAAEQPVKLRVVAYNVEFGARGTAEQIAAALEPHRPDVLLLNEAPGGDWCKRLGDALGLKHLYLGRLSSAHHKDKYKAIVSRTPLENRSEIELPGRGWRPASAVRAETRIADSRIALYALHISGGHGPTGDPAGTQAQHLFDKVLRNEPLPRAIVGGDFNDTLESKVMQLAGPAGYRPAWLDLTIDLAGEYTWNAAGPQRHGVIDHILYRCDAGMTTGDGGILKFSPVLADHHAVWAELIVPEGDR